MIPRILVPTDVRPLSPDEAAKPARRTTTYMDDRTVVPPELSDAPPLDGRSAIPDYVPLGVLANRTLVPRGMPVKPLERVESPADSTAVAVLDARVVVPTDVEPLEEAGFREFARRPEMTAELREIVDPDVFITGSPNLLIEPEVKRDAKSDLSTRVISIAVHIVLILIIVFAPGLFPEHQTQQANLLANDELNMLYTPPSPRMPPAPRLRISPRTVERLAPPVKTPEPAPAPEAPKPAPAPEAAKPAPQPLPPAPTPEIKPLQPPAPTKPLNLGIPLAPGRALQRDVQQAIREGGSAPVYSPPSGGAQAPGGGGPGMQPGLSILTPTDGVDFNPYLQRVLAIVRRNWYAIMPESAYPPLSDRGVVSTTFRINRDGSVPNPDPNLERTSGKQPLDLAALSSIKASNPFPPLPSKFPGPYIELRFVFFYNIPIDPSYVR